MSKKRRIIISDLIKILKDKNLVIEDRNQIAGFETDAYTLAKQLPLVVVLPRDETDIVEVCKYCYSKEIPLVMRGAGTSLSGGATPVKDGVLMVTSKLNKLKEIDISNRCVVVEPGYTNLDISKAVDKYGFFYAPDPSSQKACTIGGNVAENSGGVHCLKYGLTVNNILSLRAVLITGEILELGSRGCDDAGLDLLAILTGSEGLLAVVTEVTVKIIPKPEAVSTFLISFDSVTSAASCVSSIIKAGIIPAGLEMMDHDCIRACDNYCKAGYRLDAQALLIVELDGPLGEVDDNAKKVSAIAKRFFAIEIRRAKSEAEREKFWLGRKQAFPAVATLAEDFICIDCTIPRKLLAKVLIKIAKLAKKHSLTVVNVFHAGDGNLHPLILFDSSKRNQLVKTKLLCAEIMKTCVDHGGVLSGEHGIGLEKKGLMSYQFTKQELKQQLRIKCAFDDKGILNPGKMFPRLHRCAEMGMMHVHKGNFSFPELERF